MDPSDGSVSDRSSQRPDRDRASIAALPIDENEVSEDSPPNEIAISGSGDGSTNGAAPTPPHFDGNSLTVDVDGLEVGELPKVGGTRRNATINWWGTRQSTGGVVVVF